MAVILSLLPSGTLVEEMQLQIVTDVGLTIAASGENTITQTNMDTIFEKTVRRINRIVGLQTDVIGGDLVPRPSEDVLDLIVLQGECTLIQRDLELGKRNPNIKRVRLEAIELEFSDVGSARSRDLDAKFGFCADIERAIQRFLAGDAVTDAGSIIWEGTTRHHEDVTHDDQTGSHRIFNPLIEDHHDNTHNDGEPGLGEFDHR